MVKSAESAAGESLEAAEASPSRGEPSLEASSLEASVSLEMSAPGEAAASEVPSLSLLQAERDKSMARISSSDIILFIGTPFFVGTLFFIRISLPCLFQKYNAVIIATSFFKIKGY
jgi:hypothetical protein